MNFELLARLAMEENEKYKNEAFILKRRNDILHKEVDNLKAIIRKLEDEKKTFESEIESIKSYYEKKDLEEELEKPFTYYT